MYKGFVMNCLSLGGVFLILMVHLMCHGMNTELHRAVCEGNGEWVRYLIGQGADVNQKDPDGRTPLHHAAVLNAIAILKDLLQVDGIKVNEKDNRRFLH